MSIYLRLDSIWITVVMFLDPDMRWIYDLVSFRFVSFPPHSLFSFLPPFFAFILLLHDSSLSLARPPKNEHTQMPIPMTILRSS